MDNRYYWKQFGQLLVESGLPKKYYKPQVGFLNDRSEALELSPRLSGEYS